MKRIYLSAFMSTVFLCQINAHCFAFDFQVEEEQLNENLICDFAAPMDEKTLSLEINSLDKKETNKNQKNVDNKGKNNKIKENPNVMMKTKTHWSWPIVGGLFAIIGVGLWFLYNKTSTFVDDVHQALDEAKKVANNAYTSIGKNFKKFQVWLFGSSNNATLEKAPDDQNSTVLLSTSRNQEILSFDFDDWTSDNITESGMLQQMVTSVGLGCGDLIATFLCVSVVKTYLTEADRSWGIVLQVIVLFGGLNTVFRWK